MAPDAAVAALGTVVQDVITSFEGGIPFGAAAGVLERIAAVHAQVDALKLAMLAPLAQMEASGELLEEGGQKGVKNYLTHAWGIHSGEAERLALLATGLHQESLPDTAQALADGALTLGEATAIASGAEREVKKRDTTARPDAERYRSMTRPAWRGRSVSVRRCRCAHSPAPPTPSGWSSTRTGPRRTKNRPSPNAGPA